MSASIPAVIGASHASDDAMIGTVSALLGLSWIAVSLRVYVRGFMIKSFGLDDWLMLITLAFFTIEVAALLVISWIEINKGLGNLEWLSKVMTYVILEMAFYICTSIFLKLSLAVFFLRVIVDRWQRWVVYISVAVYTVYTVIYLFVVVFQCGNPSHFLVHHLEGTCLAWSVLGPMNYIHGTLNAVTDWIFALLPIFVLRTANFPRRAKLSVSFIMALGALGSVASIVRLAYVNGLNPGSSEYFVDAVDIAIASNIEPGLGIVAASLATLRPLLRAIMDRARVNVPSEIDTPEHKARPEPPVATAAELEAGDVKLGSFASYGYCEDLDKFDTATVIEVTGSSPSGAVEDVKMEHVGTEVEPPSPSEAYTPSWARVSYSTMSASRKASNTSSRIGPMTAYPRKFSMISMRRTSRATTNYRKASETWIPQNPQRETWGGFGFDLEAAKRNWQDRAMDHSGDARIWPNLLLPDVDAEDNIVDV